MLDLCINWQPENGATAAQRLADQIEARLHGMLVVRNKWLRAPDGGLVEAIEESLRCCMVVLVVLGTRWSEGLNDPDDPFRLMLAATLKCHNVRLIPVLLNGAAVPDAALLPDDLKALARRLPLSLDDEHWDLDVDRLVRTLSDVFFPAQDSIMRGGLPSTAPMAPPPAAAPAPFGVMKRGLQRIGELLRLKHADRTAPADDVRDNGPPTAWPAPGRGPQTKAEAPPPAQAADRPAEGGHPDAAPRPAVPHRYKARGEMLERIRQPPEADATETPSAPDAAAATPSAAEPVHLGASAPRRVKPGDEFTARFVAYTAEHEGEIRATLAELSPRSESHLNIKTCQWRPGTQFSVWLTARNLDISPAAQTLAWDGSKALVEFDVAVPEAAALGTTVLKYDVLIEGITVAMLRLDLEIARETSAEAAQASGSAARSAFASYSSQDRQRVLDRIDAMRIAAGLDIFLDCLSLKPSEQWKQRLDSEIRERDLFMLFWSAAAAASEWVEWEWREALALKGLDAMQIQPLENGIKPPPELEALHFGSVAMYARAEDVAGQTQVFPLSPQAGGEGRVRGETGKAPG